MQFAGEGLKLNPKDFPPRSRVAGQAAAENPGLVERITRNIMPHVASTPGER